MNTENEEIMRINAIDLKPKFNNLLVKVLQENRRTEGGIILPSVSDKKFRAAVVIRTGPSVKETKEKETVFFGVYSGIEIDDKEGIYILDEEEVYASLS